MSLGHTKQLSIDDMWPLRQAHQAKNVSTLFNSYFKRNQSIPKAFFRAFGTQFTLTGVAFLVSMLCNLMGPVVLDHVLTSLTAQDDTVPLESVFGWVAALFVAQVVQAMTDRYANFNTEPIAIQFTACLKTLMYQKSLRLNAESRKKKSLGAITTIYTLDCDSILTAAFTMHQAWLIPIQIAIVSYMLYRVLGIASFAGIGIIVVFLFANHLISKLMFSSMRAYRSSKDVRMKKITELFKAINIIKFGRPIHAARSRGTVDRAPGFTSTELRYQ